MDDNQTPNPSSLRDDIDARLPAAAFLRYEARADGWSAGRQAAFLAHLADHGVVEDAARSVGKHVSSGYALRRTARGYAFNLGWEAALIIARRVVADNLMTAAIKGEQSRWVREDGVTTYIRQNTNLSLTLLNRINPATTLTEVMAVAARFDWFVELINGGAGAEELWELFFEDALLHDDIEARARVRAALLLTADLGGFEEDGSPENVGDPNNDDAQEHDPDPIEYKSMSGPVRCCKSSAKAVSPPFQGRLTDTFRNAAGISVRAGSPLTFSFSNRATSSPWSASARPSLSAASKAFIVGP